MASITVGPPPFPDTHAEFAREIHLARVFQRTHDNALPDDVFWRYSVARHNLHPVRFDHNHPIVGHIIEKVPRPPPPVPFPMPPVAGVGVPPAVGGMTAGTVPEPAAWLILALGILILVPVMRAARRAR